MICTTYNITNYMLPNLLVFKYKGVVENQE